MSEWEQVLVADLEIGDEINFGGVWLVEEVGEDPTGFIELWLDTHHEPPNYSMTLPPGATVERKLKPQPLTYKAVCNCGWEYESREMDVNIPSHTCTVKKPKTKTFEVVCEWREAQLDEWFVNQSSHGTVNWLCRRSDDKPPRYSDGDEWVVTEVREVEE